MIHKNDDESDDDWDSIAEPSPLTKKNVKAIEHQLAAKSLRRNVYEPDPRLASIAIDEVEVAGESSPLQSKYLSLSKQKSDPQPIKLRSKSPPSKAERKGKLIKQHDSPHIQEEKEDETIPPPYEGSPLKLKRSHASNHSQRKQKNFSGKESSYTTAMADETPHTATPPNGDVGDGSGQHFLYPNSKKLYKFAYGKYDELGLSIEEEESHSFVQRFANKYDNILTTFWTEFFTVIRLVSDFVILFAVNLFRYLIRDLVQPLTVGIALVICDYLFKPALVVLFSGILQPFLVFAWNVATSCAKACEPIAQVLKQLCNIFVDLCRAFRLVEVNIVREGKAGATETV